MREFLRKNFRPRRADDPPFVSGFVGFVSYDLGAKWSAEQSLLKVPVKVPVYEAICPDAHFVFVDRVFTNFEKTDQFMPGHQSQNIQQNWQVPSGREEYFEKISRIKEYLYAGETYQVNFSQKFEAPYNGNAFELYQKLSAINPSPFQFFMETSDWAIISNSPERLFKIRKQDGLMPPQLGSCGSRAEAAKGRGASPKRSEASSWGKRSFPQIISTRPIKGTMPRGRTPEEDAINIQKLLASPKEAAELAMIVDLERNDLGKLCKPGTVEVNEDRVIEKYSHVIHTVSNIRGVLMQQYDWYDALKALFPGGSVTGAPKKRTIEIISKLEGEPRGIYCGSAGWIDLSGECDFNIMIRTLWLEKNKNGGTLIFRSGGGIVVDSDPQKEYEETIHKAEALFSAMNVLK